DDELRTLEEFRHGGKERSFRRMTGQQELPHLKCPEVEVSTPYEERDRSSSPAEAGRLEINENCPVVFWIRGLDRTKRRIEDAQPADMRHLAIADSHVAMPPARFIPAIDDEATAKSRLDRAPAEHRANARDVHHRLVLAAVGLVGQLALRRRASDDGAQA